MSRLTGAMSGETVNEIPGATVLIGILMTDALPTRRPFWSAFAALIPIYGSIWSGEVCIAVAALRERDPLEHDTLRTMR